MGQSYRDLIAWQKAMDFVMDVYRTSKAFPRDDDCAEPDLFFSRTREGSHGQSGRVAEDTKRSDRRHSASGLAESKEPGSGNWYYRPRTCIPFSSAFFSVSRQRRPMCLAAPLSSRKTGTVLT